LRIVKASNGVLMLGKQGENKATQVQFTVEAWIKELGDGSFQLLHQRNTDQSPHAVVITYEDGIVYWDVENTEVAVVGYGKCELQFYQGQILAKSQTWITQSVESLSAAGSTPPEPWESWVEEVLAAAATAEEAAEDAEDAKDDAETARDNAVTAKTQAEAAKTAAETAQVQAASSKDAAIAAKNDAITAKNEAVQAKNDAVTAKGQAETAKGQAEGFATSAGQAASNAATQAGNASQSATQASGYATQAEGFATEAQEYKEETETLKEQTNTLKTQAEAAKTAAETAQSSAEVSSQNAAVSEENASGYATQAGQSATSAGTSAQTATSKASEAATSADSAEDSAEDAEAWAVGKRGGVDVPSTDPAYHNSSKYHADESKEAKEDIEDSIEGVAQEDTAQSALAKITQITQFLQTIVNRHEEVRYYDTLPAQGTEGYTYITPAGTYHFHDGEYTQLSGSGDLNGFSLNLGNGNVVMLSYTDPDDETITDTITMGTDTTLNTIYLALKQTADSLKAMIGVEDAT